jgi:hypothetical protein
MSNVPTLKEFNAGNGRSPFIVFDRTLNEYWKKDGFARTRHEAQVFYNGFETQEQLDSAWKHGCRLEFLSRSELDKRGAK